MEEENEERDLIVASQEALDGLDGVEAPVAGEEAVMGTWCYTDGSWAANDKWSGLGWIVRREGKEILFGVSSVPKV
ncbi:unnamed protein product [Cochlearia groenlandica]